ncbi:uncharacterized protein [Primulina huaijiensis]|uniref:uncharacterized protein n=1 Tax=Primulina huaijiensis TaxID=1492673 RepID=UPI003CC73822
MRELAYGGQENDLSVEIRVICLKIAHRRIFIAGVVTNALLDSKATHSFISDSFVSYLGVKPTRLDVNYSVTGPSGGELSASSVVMDIDLELQGHTVYADLIVLLMPEFDIILIMDWLSKNGVLIDLQRRSVLVRQLGMEKFVFEPDGYRNLPRMISCVWARMLMYKRCQTFLASIISAPDTTSKSLTDIPVVRDFPDAFPDDIVGILPEREVEFSIDLMPGTVPISKAPYRLAPAEMKESKQ